MLEIYRYRCAGEVSKLLYMRSRRVLLGSDRDMDEYRCGDGYEASDSQVLTVHTHNTCRILTSYLALGATFLARNIV